MVKKKEKKKKTACKCRRCKRSRIQSLGLEDPLEEEMATHSRLLLRSLGVILKA